MKGLLIDENLPAGLIRIVGAGGVHATALGAQLTDEALWLHARQKNLVILTRDADFFDKLVIHGTPPKVVWLRTGNLRRVELEALVARSWPKVQVLLEVSDLIEIHLERLEALKF